MGDRQEGRGAGGSTWLHVAGGKGSGLEERGVPAGCGDLVPLAAGAREGTAPAQRRHQEDALPQVCRGGRARGERTQGERGRGEASWSQEW